MKSLMITAPASGSGKTTITLGLIRALKDRGLDVCAYKTGPDYIDRAFLEEISGLPVGNLDFHLQGEEGVRHSFSRAPADLCIVEGVMGYFDGIANTYQNSCYDISRKLNIPSLLVYTPKGEMFSAIPKIMGMVNFGSSTLKGILLNQTSEKIYQMLKAPLEEHTGLEVIGYLPSLKEATLQSRHLGLVQSQETSELKQKIDRVARAIRETVDLERLLKLMNSTDRPEVVERFTPSKREVVVAIARDTAFSFYYRENLELLEEACQVVYFSPLDDGEVPECDLVYLGGGYPELFAEQLSANRSMLASIRAYVEQGGYLFAECGGLLYLTEMIEAYPVAGIFQGSSHLTERLQRFGYIDICLSEDCALGPKGTKMTAHEFHRTTTSVSAPTLFDISKTQGPKKWTCGFHYKNVIAGYPHINFLGNFHVLEHLLERVEKDKLR